MVPVKTLQQMLELRDKRRHLQLMKRIFSALNGTILHNIKLEFEL